MVALAGFNMDVGVVIALIIFVISGIFIVVPGVRNFIQRPQNKRMLILLSKKGDIINFSKNEEQPILKLKENTDKWRLKGQGLTLSGAAVSIGVVLMLFSSVSTGILYLGSGCFVAGICLYMFQRGRNIKKRKLLSTQFPEALDLMVRGARVGVSAEGNIRDAAKELPSPIADVFKNMQEQLEIGLSFDDVLSAAAFTNEIREFRYLAATLSVQRKTGGAYANVLENLSAVLREHQEQNERVDAVTTEAKVSAKVVAGVGLASCILLFFQNRTQFDFLIQDPTGQLMALYCFLSIVFGTFLIRQMLASLS